METRIVRNNIPMNLSFPAAATRWCHLLVVGLALAGCVHRVARRPPRSLLCPLQAPTSLLAAKAPARIGLALE